MTTQTNREIRPNLQAHDEAQQVEMFPGVVRRTLNAGERTSIHEIEIAAGGCVPMHTHPHEQIGYLVSGRVKFELGDETKELSAGDSWIIPSAVPHEVTALEDSVALDIFSPAREEFIP
ncbi:MAG: cupin domain-containing protein [Chloroflexi bacterium]|nr:cupin domain-containing protein [Chloroflexota bacterium]MCY3697450.1 cupin domain-containing protein [Chloroflexota bacterium]